jgi:SAM-dependent methyltransferase
VRSPDELERLAVSYLDKRAIGEAQLDEFLDTIMALGHRGLILDIGCGPGRILAPLAARLHPQTIIGLDISLTMLVGAREYFALRRINNCVVVRADLNTPLPFRSSQFHKALLFQSIHFACQPQLLALELKRILQPDGFVIVGSTSHKQLRQLPYSRCWPGIVDRELHRTPDAGTIKSAFESAGFAAIHEREIVFYRGFGSAQELRACFNRLPFSVLAALEPEEFKKGLALFEKNVLREYGQPPFTLPFDAVQLLVFWKAPSWV